MTLLAKVVLTLGVALALITQSSPATAAPAPVPSRAVASPETRPSFPRRVDPTKLSRAEKAAIKHAKKIFVRAVNRRTRTLDYRLAKKYDDGHVKVRRKMAAGWYVAGGRIRNISSAEWRRVRGYLPGRRAAIHRSGLRAPARCTGRSALRVRRFRTVDGLPGYDSTQWYNSCQTDRLIETRSSASSLFGFVSAAAVVLPGPAAKVVAVIAAGTSAVLALTKDRLGSAQNRSSVRAIIIRTHYETQQQGQASRSWSTLRPQ